MDEDAAGGVHVLKIFLPKLPKRQIFHATTFKSQSTGFPISSQI
jgi:hypothetical protein